MKVILKERNKYVIRFDKGDELIANLMEFCQTKKIRAGFFVGLGATSQVVLSYYHLDKKEYQEKKIAANLEIVSLIGNLAEMAGKIIIHSHGVFSDVQMKTWAGHVNKLVISGTGEVLLEVFKGKIERQYSQEIGLNLMK